MRDERNGEAVLIRSEGLIGNLVMQAARNQPANRRPQADQSLRKRSQALSRPVEKPIHRTFIEDGRRLREVSAGPRATREPDLGKPVGALYRSREGLMLR